MLNSVETISATIYVGLKERSSGVVVDRAIPITIIQEYVDTVGLCVSITDTMFVYSKGGEPGLMIGFINYPRFPAVEEVISAQALDLASKLLIACKQLRVTVVGPNRTTMLTNAALLDEVLTNACPVCGYLFDRPAAEFTIDFTICPSCGTEFGYDDSGRTHAELRADWLRDGAKWWCPIISPPSDWNPYLQIDNLFKQS